MDLSLFSSQLRLWKQIPIATLVLAALAGCATTPAAPTPVPQSVPQIVLELSGSTQVVPILRAIEPAFEADTPGYQLEIIDVTTAASSQAAALEGVVKDVLDVAAMSRSLKDAERAQNLEYTEFGQAGFSIIIQQDIGVASLTDEQVVSIFAGTVTNWSEVGGPNRPIVVFHREEDNTTTESLRKSLFGDRQFAKTSQQVDQLNAMLVVISSTPGGVGYALWPAVMMEGGHVAAVSLQGISPTTSGYPIVQPLGLGYRQNRKADIQPLISWLLSERGRTELRKLGVIAPSA